ncbi:MAG: isocitrate lyase/phosphoenolpyruvate mutase family protein [Pseudomonadota bacterium]
MTAETIGARFRALHRPGEPFVLANVWDAGSARLLAAMGAEALATASAAHAQTLGRPDGGHVTRDEALAHAAEIVRATPLPVSGDLENGYGPTPEDAARTVRQAAVAGLAGCSIEDTDLPGRGLYEFDQAVARVEAAVAAARDLDEDFVLCARADGMLSRSYDLDEALRRLKAFEAAGADCLYAPGAWDIDTIRRITDAVSAPVNILVAGPLTKLGKADFADAGVARLSLGPMLARTATQAVLRAGEAILSSGDFSRLADAADGRQIDKMLAAGADAQRLEQ